MHWTQGQMTAALLGAGLLFAIELGLSIALVAIDSLSRVALHRLREQAAGKFEFLDEVGAPLSAHRSAALLVRQFCLLGSMALLFVAGLARRRPTESELLGIGLGAAIVGVRGGRIDRGPGDRPVEPTGSCWSPRIIVTPVPAAVPDRRAAQQALQLDRRISQRGPQRARAGRRGRCVDRGRGTGRPAGG